MEGNETFTVSLGTVAGTTETITATDTAEVTINDDDTSTLMIADMTVNESEGTVDITVELNQALANNFTVVH